MSDKYIFVYEYKRKGETNHWVATKGTRMKLSDADRWPDREPSVEQSGRHVVISLRCDEALEEDDEVIAEELAIEELKRRFPGAVIRYQED